MRSRCSNTNWKLRQPNILCSKKFMNLAEVDEDLYCRGPLTGMVHPSKPEALQKEVIDD